MCALGRDKACSPEPCLDVDFYRDCISRSQDDGSLGLGQTMPISAPGLTHRYLESAKADMGRGKAGRSRTREIRPKIYRENENEFGVDPGNRIGFGLFAVMNFQLWKTSRKNNII